jgi:3-hydroxybutyryl-CoA dehydrogenase
VAEKTIETVGVVGLGTMGAGIAQVCVLAGLAVVGRELTGELCERARAAIQRHLDRGVEKGRLTAGDRDAALARLSLTTEMAQLAGCDLIIEAALEELDVKQAVFRELHAVAAPHAILATNTSALSVTAIASATPNPERVVGLHFFNPAPVLPLVEVVRTELCSEETFDEAYAFVERVGKLPVVCRDTPGFVVNRILVPMLNDAVRALDEGVASPEDVDRAMVAGANWPIGPLALIDLIGVDVQVHASEALWEAFREARFAPPPRLQRMLEAGHVGRKAGQGFYSYD